MAVIRGGSKHGLDLTTGDPIYWFDRRKGHPKRRHQDPKTGKVITEKLPQGPYRPMLSPVGNIVNLCLSEGASSPSQTPYAVKRVNAKMRAGFVPADECPIAAHRMPTNLVMPGDKACEGSQSQTGMPVRLKQPCEHLHRIAESRRNAKRIEDEQWEKAFESQVQAMGNEQAKAMQGLAETQTELVQAIKDIRGESRKSK